MRVSKVDLGRICLGKELIIRALSNSSWSKVENASMWIAKGNGIELFQPFVIHRLIRQNIVNNIKAAKKLIQKADDEVMQVLQEVIEGHPILLNRAPTLHRLVFKL